MRFLLQVCQECPPLIFFLNKRNKNDFTSCSFQNVGQETPVSPHLLGMGNTVNNICLGCWPSKFVFLSTTGNASSPNHPLALKRIKHNNNNKKQIKTFKSKNTIKKPGQNVRFFLTALSIFSSEASQYSCSIGKLLAILQFLAIQDEIYWVEGNTCTGEAAALRATDQMQAEEASAGQAVKLLESQVKEPVATK